MTGLEAIGLVALGSIAFGTTVVLADAWLLGPLRRLATEPAILPPAGGDDAASVVRGEGELFVLDGVHTTKLGRAGANFAGNRESSLP